MRSSTVFGWEYEPIPYSRLYEVGAGTGTGSPCFFNDATSWSRLSTLSERALTFSSRVWIYAQTLGSLWANMLPLSLAGCGPLEPLLCAYPGPPDDPVVGAPGAAKAGACGRAGSFGRGWPL